MRNLTLIILTYNEAIHIERCILSAIKLKSRVVVIDSFSNDETISISKLHGAEVFQNPFVNQAQQFQWAIENCNIETPWVLRLDADETIDSELTQNINQFISSVGNGHNGAIFHRKHIFLGKWIKHGGRYPLPMLRLFRHGKAHIEQRWMDEHIVLDEGSSCLLEGGFEDNNLNSITWFIDKHNAYATREMLDIMIKRLIPDSESKITEGTSAKIKLVRFLKQSIYMKLPYFLRPALYFISRYFFQLGFLDGSKGFAYHFTQGFWYRALVDLKCLEADIAWKDCSSDIEKIKTLEKLAGYSLDHLHPK